MKTHARASPLLSYQVEAVKRIARGCEHEKAVHILHAVAIASGWTRNSLARIREAYLNQRSDPGPKAPPDHPRVIDNNHILAVIDATMARMPAPPVVDLSIQVGGETDSDSDSDSDSDIASGSGSASFLGPQDSIPIMK